MNNVVIKMKEILDSIKETFLSFTDYDTCSTRKEYWTYMVFVVFVVLLLYVFLFAFFSVSGHVKGTGDGLGNVTNTTVSFVPMSSLGSILLFLLFVVLAVPGVAVTIRRLHDSGHSGFWFLIQLLPTVGAFILLIFMLLPTNPNSEYRDDLFDVK